jgi:Transposase
LRLKRISSFTRNAPISTQPVPSANNRVNAFTVVPDDQAITATPVELHLRVKRARSTNPGDNQSGPSCEELLPIRARRATRIRAAQRFVTLAVGGEVGSRLLTQCQPPTSPDTLLRSVRSLPIPPPDTPRVLGVDDFSFRRARTSGTILVDLEQHRVVDVLEDGEVTSVTWWRIAHPGVEIMSCDRCAAYAQGAVEDVLNAAHVADRSTSPSTSVMRRKAGYVGMVGSRKTHSTGWQRPTLTTSHSCAFTATSMPTVPAPPRIRWR